MHDPREELTRLLGVPHDEVPLGRSALWIAAEEYRGLDVADYLGRIDELAEAAAARQSATASARDRVGALIRFLFEEEGFRGNREDFYDPRNSFLNEVLDRHTGLPITLSILVIEIGNRLDLPIQGVGFPGHFLIKHAGDD